MTVENWDASLLSFSSWRRLLEENLRQAKRFEIHCWNEESPWISLALRFGVEKNIGWEWGVVIEGCVTPAFSQMLLAQRRPEDRELYKKFTPFFSIFLDNGFASEHYGTELTLPCGQMSSGRMFDRFQELS